MNKISKEALVIGNNDYIINPLTTPINDAKDITVFLNENGFSVTPEYNLTYQKFYAIIDEFGEKTKNANVRFFYYSGHGINYQGKNYLVPIDVELNDISEFRRCVDLEDVLYKLQLNKSATNIIILDSCNANPTNFQFKGSSDITGFSSVQIPNGTIIGYAAKAGTFAIANNGSRNSLYTSNLLKYIKEANLEIEKVLKYTRRDVINDTDWKQIPCDLSEFIGEFTFIGDNKYAPIEDIVLENTKNTKELVELGYGTFKDENGKIRISIAPTVFVAHRIAKAFPGVRNIKWFNGEQAIKGISRFLKYPLRFDKAEGHGLYRDPIWWFRGGSALSIDKFEVLSDDKVLIGVDELKINKIAVFNASSYYHSFVYVETLPDEPTGVYEYSEGQIDRRTQEFGYADEEFGLFNGTPIKREEYDDGAAIINGEYVDTINAKLRCRFLSKYNFIIVAKSSPYNSREGNLLGSRYMNAILKGESSIEEFAEEAQLLQKNHMDE